MMAKMTRAQCAMMGDALADLDDAMVNCTAELLGEVAVESGNLAIGDLPPGEDVAGEPRVVVDCRVGDGLYPVYGLRDDQGVVAWVVVPVDLYRLEDEDGDDDDA
jgi:hypothetical protein